MNTIKRLANGDFVISANLMPAFMGSGVNPFAAGTLKWFFTELQDDGTLLTWDKSDNTFKATAIATGNDNLAANHQKCNNGTKNTGIWTAVIPGGAFTDGKRYTYRLAGNPDSSCVQMGDFTLES